ncbi:MAG: hypothetical protein GY849_02640 [Deltaproteobacteria bacterium]|nr:hypothetical protein [Deltaproteobacteria bacterium]
MKININKLFVLETNYIDYWDIDDIYLEKATNKKPEYIEKYGKFLKITKFNKKCEKFTGCNISKLYHSYKKENQKYSFGLMELIREKIDITNKSNEIVNEYGEEENYRSEFYTDENNIIRKYDRPNIRKKQKEKTKLELIADCYFQKKYELEYKENSLINYDPYFRVKRFLKNDIEELKEIENEYNSLYNFLHNRDTRDKSDKKIRILKTKVTPKNININKINKYEKR